MKSDKELLDNFYQVDNVVQLENLIDNLYSPEEEREKNKDILGADEISDLFDNLVYPTVKELIPVDCLEKPELVVYDSRLLDKNTNQLLKKKILYGALRAGCMWGICTGGIGAITGIVISSGSPEIGIEAPLILSTLGGLSGFVAGGIISIPISIIDHKLHKMMSSGYTTDLDNIIYVKSSNYPETTQILAHETTHQFMAQLSKELWKQPYLREGLAEAVAFEASRQLTNVIEPDQKYEFKSLRWAYHDLCDKLKIKSQNRKVWGKQETRPARILRRLIKTVQAPYSTGYAAIRLLQEEKGTKIFKELAGYRSLTEN